MKRNLVLVLIAIFCFGVIASAKTKKVKLTGVIVDKACAAKEKNQKDPSGHTKKCALMENCLKSGLGVFSDGKYYEFDANGTQLAKGVLEKSKLEKDVKVVVEGTADEATPTVVTVKKISAAK